MFSIFTDLEAYLQSLYPQYEVITLEYEVNVGQDEAFEVNQLLIRDLEPEKQNDGYIVYKKIGFVFKHQQKGEAESIVKEIEEHFSKKIGGKLTTDVAYQGIVNTKPTTFISSAQARKEGTSIFNTEFQFTYLNFNLIQT